MATLLDVTGTRYAGERNGQPVPALEGASLRPAFEADGLPERPMFWEHEGNAAVRVGRWKLVRKFPDPWELYDLETDRTELNDLSAKHPGRVQEMLALYQAWATRCGVIPREKILEIMARNPEPAFWEEKEDA